MYYVCVFVCVFLQFQSVGDPKTGTVVSAQEAQAQAILLQTKVNVTVSSLKETHTHEELIWNCCSLCDAV